MRSTSTPPVNSLQSARVRAYVRACVSVPVLVSGTQLRYRFLLIYERMQNKRKRQDMFPFFIRSLRPINARTPATDQRPYAGYRSTPVRRLPINARTPATDQRPYAGYRSTPVRRLPINARTPATDQRPCTPATNQRPCTPATNQRPCTPATETLMYGQFFQLMHCSLLKENCHPLYV